MTNHAVDIWTSTQSMTIPSYLTSKMHLQNSLTKRNFKAGSWIFKQEFAQKRRISRSYCSGSRDRSNQLAEGPRQSQSQLREKISLIMQNWIWWWRQNWNGATILPVWSAKFPSVEPWSGRLKNVFSGRQLDLVPEETLVVFYTRMPRETVRTTWDELEIRNKFSPRASILFSTESEETDWREKLEQCEGQSCDWSLKSLVFSGQDEKDLRVIVDIIPCVVVTCLETDAFMAIVAYFDIQTVKGNPARVRKEEVTSRISCYCEWKTSQRLCISRLGSNEFYSTESWRTGIERFGGTHQIILRMHLVQNWIRDYPKRWTSWAKSLRAQFWEETPEETSRQADCTSKVAWNLARNYASSKPKTTTFYSLGRRQRHRRSHVCHGFGSFNAQCSARRFEFRYNAYFEKVQKT